jgi:DNA repair exonuclease SbcCD ATPase subunit
MSEKKEVKSYKVSPELKEKLETLFAESGLETQEAFLEHVAALYEMQRLKEGGAVGYKKQLDELEYHTRRSVELFLSMLETETAERLQLTQQHEETLADRAATIFNQEQEIADLRKETKQQADELARLGKENEALAKQAEQLAEISRKDNLLVEEYRQRIDTLSGLVNEYKAAADENKDLKAQLTELTQLTNQQSRQIEELQQEIKDLEELSNERIRAQEARHKEDMERLAERKDLEKERDLLHLRTEYQAKLEKINEEATAKLRELYEQINQMRRDHEQEIAALKKGGKTQ